MKRWLKRCLQTGMRSDIAWKIARHLPVRGIDTARKVVLANRLIRRFDGRSVVQAGPFQGLVYPTLRANGSELLPKLLGTYESELHGAIRAACSESFDHIIDIGCAEGYYAVGLARRFPRAKVVAFDISDRARELCRAMAAANGTTNVEVRAACTKDDLRRLPTPGRHLIVSDCEGFERHLFDGEVARQVADSFVIIEMHDHEDPTTSAKLTAWFRQTHRVEVISSIPDRVKASQYKSAVVEGRDLIEKEAAFAERRGDTPTLWLVGVPQTLRRSGTRTRTFAPPSLAVDGIGRIARPSS